MIVAVLAGGRGSRIGGDKACVPFRGRPLVHWPLAAAQAAGLRTVVLAKRATALPADLAAEVWLEPDAPSHPLTGIVAALERAAGEDVLAVGCDMPFLTSAALLAFTRAPASADPLPALLGAAQLPALRDALAREAPLRATLRELDAETVALDPALTRSVNAAEDLLP